MKTYKNAEAMMADLNAGLTAGTRFSGIANGYAVYVTTDFDEVSYTAFDHDSGHVGEWEDIEEAVAALMARASGGLIPPAEGTPCGCWVFPTVEGQTLLHTTRIHGSDENVAIFQGAKNVAEIQFGSIIVYGHPFVRPNIVMFDDKGEFEGLQHLPDADCTYDALRDIRAHLDAAATAAAVEPAPMSADLSLPIHNLADGVRFLCDLIDDGRAFHLEDEPVDIINLTTGQNIFSEAEAKIIAAQVARLYLLDWEVFDCPIGAMMAFEGDALVVHGHHLAQRDGQFFPAFKEEGGEPTALPFENLLKLTGSEYPPMADRKTAAAYLMTYLASKKVAA